MVIEAAGKFVKKKATQTMTLARKILGMMMAWGLVFSLVTIGDLKVAFDFDDTLVFSTPSYTRAFQSGVQPFSPKFWEVVNSSYHLERPKPVPYAIAWMFRILGFDVTVLTSRPGYGGESLKKEWRFLATNFIFTSGSANKYKYLINRNYILFFGDSDSDIIQGRRAKVLTLRVKRSAKSSYREDYHPGSLREIVIPFTEY